MWSPYIYNSSFLCYYKFHFIRALHQHNIFLMLSQNLSYELTSMSTYPTQCLQLFISGFKRKVFKGSVHIFRKSLVSYPVADPAQTRRYESHGIDDPKVLWRDTWCFSHLNSMAIVGTELYWEDGHKWFFFFFFTMRVTQTLARVIVIGDDAQYPK